MYRRHFCRFAAISAAGLPLMVRSTNVAACDMEIVSDPEGTPVADAPMATAGTLFRWPGDKDLRVVMIRIRQWPNETLAIDTQDTLMSSVGPDLPPGEFSATEPITIDVPEPDGGEDVALVGWTTIAGVAAYQTGIAVLTVRLGSLLWDASITAASPQRANGFAIDLIPLLLEDFPACGLLEDFLPTLDEMPAGATEEPYPAKP